MFQENGHTERFHSPGSVRSFGDLWVQGAKAVSVPLTAMHGVHLRTGSKQELLPTRRGAA